MCLRIQLFGTRGHLLARRGILLYYVVELENSGVNLFHARALFLAGKRYLLY